MAFEPVFLQPLRMMPLCIIGCVDGSSTEVWRVIRVYGNDPGCCREKQVALRQRQHPGPQPDRCVFRKVFTQ